MTETIAILESVQKQLVDGRDHAKRIGARKPAKQLKRAIESLLEEIDERKQLVKFMI